MVQALCATYMLPDNHIEKSTNVLVASLPVRVSGEFRLSHLMHISSMPAALFCLSCSVCKWTRHQRQCICIYVECFPQATDSFIVYMLQNRVKPDPSLAICTSIVLLVTSKLNKLCLDASSWCESSRWCICSPCIFCTLKPLIFDHCL